jgi:hypothetical protein
MSITMCIYIYIFVCKRLLLMKCGLNLNISIIEQNNIIIKLGFQTGRIVSIDYFR